MGNVNVNRIGPDAQRDRELEFSERLSRAPAEYDPWRPAAVFDAAQILAVGGVLGATWLGVLLALAVARLVVCWGGACAYRGEPFVGWLMWAWIALPVVGALVGGATWLWSTLARTRAEAARMAVTRDRWGNPVSAAAVARDARTMSPAEAFYRAAQAEVAMAPYRVYRGADALSLSQAPAAEAPLLAEAGPAIGPLSLEQWAAFVDRQPHTMLAAKTGGGKSTMAKFILAGRITAGEQVFIIDPHWSPSNWWGLPGYGGGEAWEEIAQAFELVIDEYLSRLHQYKAGRPTEEFRRLTVLVDEAVITKAEFDRKDKWGRSSPWARFAVVLGSGARKVRLSVILMTQSPNVADLGLSAPLRENYSRIALDARACRLLIEEDASRERREALYDALPRQGDYPATMEMAGEVYYLDRSAVVDVERPRAADDAVWGVMPRLSVSDRPATPVEAPSTALQTQTDRQTAPDRLALLRALRQAGYTRERAREELRKGGIEFDNGLWTEAGRAA